MSTNKTLKTQDLNLSAVLLTKGYELQSIFKGDLGKATFIFEDSPEIRGLIQGYWNNRVGVNPQELFYSLKQLKNRLYSNY